VQGGNNRISTKLIAQILFQTTRMLKNC